jgi:hypothetical protein
MSDQSDSELLKSASFRIFRQCAVWPGLCKGFVVDKMDGASEGDPVSNFGNGANDDLDFVDPAHIDGRETPPFGIRVRVN